MRGCVVTSVALLRGDSCSGREKPAAKRGIAVTEFHAIFRSIGAEVPVRVGQGENRGVKLLHHSPGERKIKRQNEKTYV